MNIADALEETSVSSLDLTRYVSVAPTSSVRETVGQMCQVGLSCACVVEGDSLVGIFTQRDVVLRVLGRSRIWDVPISEEMTTPVRTVRNDQSVADGLAIMSDWWVRSVPVVDAGDSLVGNLSFYTVMTTMANLLSSLIGDTALEPDVGYGLSYVDFTGLNIAPPVMVGMDDSVEVAVHHMRARGIGSVMVTDHREHLVGVLTEFDLVVNVGCERPDLSVVAIKDVMTSDPVTLSARSSIADAIQEMAERGFSHVPLVGESGRPVGVATFRDIAAYVEASLDSLG